MKGIGPRKYPYRSRSQVTRQLQRDRQVYWTDDPLKIPRIPCPDCGEPGHCYLIEDVGLIVPCETGRVRGSAMMGDERVLYEIKSYCHLPVSERPPLPRAYTKRIAAATSYYDLYPADIDPEYDPSQTVVDPVNPPVEIVDDQPDTEESTE